MNVNKKKRKKIIGPNGEDLSHVDYVVCMPWDVTIADSDAAIRKCDANCGTLIMYPKFLPKVLPKVCPHCNGWLSNCVGNA
jgi:hypothetical protein